MTLIIFIIILGLLVFVHELGHFLVAKKAGVKVQEFGFGYPPRAYTIGEKWGTVFTLNWIPFGGFVKIFGEDYEGGQEKSSSFSIGRSFVEVSKKWQAAILAAGVTFNIVFAWFLFSLGFLIGVPTPVENDFGMAVKNPELTIIGVVSGSPAQNIGLKSGDKINAIASGENIINKELEPAKVSNLIKNSEGEINLTIARGREVLNFSVSPEMDAVENKKIIGINMDMVGTLSLPLHKAIYEGGRTTLELSYLTVGGIWGLIKDALVGQADLSKVSGPVGIVGMVGDASRLGFAYLLTFTALISINLAIINLFPFPALDGGRIVFVAIEGLTRKKISAKVAGTLNTVGFALLILLMLFITYRDILKLF